MVAAPEKVLVALCFKLITVVPLVVFLPQSICTVSPIFNVVDRCRSIRLTVAVPMSTKSVPAVVNTPSCKSSEDVVSGVAPMAPTLFTTLSVVIKSPTAMPQTWLG